MSLLLLFNQVAIVVAIPAKSFRMQDRNTSFKTQDRNTSFKFKRTASFKFEKK